MFEHQKRKIETDCDRLGVNVPYMFPRDLAPNGADLRFSCGDLATPRLSLCNLHQRCVHSWIVFLARESVKG